MYQIIAMTISGL